MLPVALRAGIRPHASSVSVIHRRVLPSEIDTNLHMNQAVYAEVFELGRVDWMVGTGAWMHWRAAGANPMVAQQTITYRRELKPFQPYRIETRAVGTDGRMVRMQGVLAVGDRVHALGEQRLMLVGKDGVLPAAEVEALLQDRVVEPLQIDDWTLVSR